ncbi:MAG: SufE family protein [Pseudomonadota bacterium]
MESRTVTPISDIQEEIVEEFSFFDDWMDRYQYIIDLGRKLPDFPEDQRVDENRLYGCQSQVWLTAHGDAGELTFRAVSDSAIVCGLIALVLRVYSGQPASEILAHQPQFVEDIGLKSHLSPTRSNGLASMLATIRQHASSSLAAAAS